MSIILTSFKESKRIMDILSTNHIYSVSRWQPYQYTYDVLDFFGAYNIDGDRLRLKDSSISEYKHELYKYYVHRRKDINEWLISLDQKQHIILCCWCPYSKNTQKHIKEKGSFICHTGLIGKIIQKFRPDIEIILDNDRHKWLVDDYKPINYKVI